MNKRSFLFFKKSKKAQAVEGLVDIFAVFFLILLFVVAFILASGQKDKITREFVDSDVKGLSLDYTALNLMRQNSMDGQISEEIRLFCKEKISYDQLKAAIGKAMIKVENPYDIFTFEIKDNTCGNNLESTFDDNLDEVDFVETFVNLPDNKKQSNCADPYKTQIEIANGEKTPILLDVNQQICVVSDK